jgi:hypothetical protein
VVQPVLQSGVVVHVGSLQPVDPLQFASTLPLQTSGAGVTDPVHGPHCGASLEPTHDCEPSLH